MGNYQRKKKGVDAINVERFLDDLRQGAEDYSPPKPPAQPTLKQFLLSVAFLAAQVLIGSVIIGVALRIILAVVGL